MAMHGPMTLELKGLLLMQHPCHGISLPLQTVHTTFFLVVSIRMIHLAFFARAALVWSSQITLLMFKKTPQQVCLISM